MPFRKSARSGDERNIRDPGVQFAIGDQYFLGDGVGQDYAAALEWYRKASQKGDPAAQAWLDWMMKQAEP